MFGKRKKLESQLQKLKDREKDISALSKNFQAQIAELTNRLEEKKIEYVVVLPPEESDLMEYNRQIAEFAVNPFYLSFFEQEKREIIAAFSGSGRQTPEYYKGQLHLIGKIFSASRDARTIFEVIRDKAAEKETDEE
jgi:hypothetical protein